MARRSEIATEHLPPHNLDAEQAVLGACLADRDVILHIADLLKSEHFYRRSHQLIYTAIRTLYDARTPADLIAVVDYLSRQGQLEEIGSEDYLAQLIESTPAIAHARYYAEIVIAHSLRRAGVSAASDIAQLSYDTALEPDELIRQIEETIQSIGESYAYMGEQVQSMAEIVDEYWDTMDVEQGNPVQFGIPTLDYLTGGMLPGQFIVIGARTNVGKTAMGLSIAYHAASAGRTVGIVSLEMSDAEILQRFLAMRTGLSTHQVRSLRSLGAVEQAQVTEAMAQLAEWKVMVTDSTSDKLEVLIRQVRAMHTRRPLELLIVDYIQLLRLLKRTHSRVDELEQITGDLKRLGRELDVPVLAMAQANRGAEDHKVLQLSDFRSSGSIEQDADIALLLNEDDQAETEHSARLICQLAKHRNGPKGIVNLRRINRTTQVVEEA